MQRIANPSTPVRFRPQPHFIMEKFQTDCLILGGGVAGLAIGANIADNYKECFLVEKNNDLGLETSSRNSEVIHAGIYYEKDSLRSRLCIEGKELLYSYLSERGIDYNNCGKFILSSSIDETDNLYKIQKNAMECGVEDLVFKNKSILEYPFLHYHEYLFSPSTGIFDSYTFMNSLRDDFEDEGGIILKGNKVISVSSNKDSFSALIHDCNNEIDFEIQTKILINCLGLEAVEVSNNLHEEQRYELKLLKGDYYSYSGSEKLAHLIYPIPKEYSLGTHATIDLGYGIKFGPSAYEVKKVDYTISNDQKPFFLESIRSYWPDIDENKLNPSYSGIRPLLKNQKDFVIDISNFDDNILVDILGYSSPGLTSSLATAKYVRDMMNKY